MPKDAAEAELFEAAKAARLKAYAPHSNFLVGAAVRTAAGNIYAGCNIENQSYPEGWCAETSAISHMIMAGDKDIVAVCVVAEHDEPITPCGGCRQRLSEFSRPSTTVAAGDMQKITARFTLGDLLPAAFRLEDEE